MLREQVEVDRELEVRERSALAQIDELLGQAATAPERPARARAYKELQVILNEDLPSLVLFDEETVDTASRKLAGVFPGLDARDQWAGVRRTD